VRRFADTFGDAPAIVTPSGSCAAMVVEHYARLARRLGDERLAVEVEAVAGRVHELSRFLVEVLGVEDVGARFPHRVTYHASCHATRGMHVGDAPLRLLRAVDGIDLVELPEATTPEPPQEWSWALGGPPGLDETLGGDYYRKRDPERITKRLIAHLESLGHYVILQELPQAP
jgi:Fe-S oxidoreductase